MNRRSSLRSIKLTTSSSRFWALEQKHPFESLQQVLRKSSSSISSSTSATTTITSRSELGSNASAASSLSSSSAPPPPTATPCTPTSSIAKTTNLLSHDDQCDQSNDFTTSSSSTTFTLPTFSFKRTIKGSNKGWNKRNKNKTKQSIQDGTTTISSPSKSFTEPSNNCESNDEIRSQLNPSPYEQEDYSNDLGSEESKFVDDEDSNTSQSFMAGTSSLLLSPYGTTTTTASKRVQFCTETPFVHYFPKVTENSMYWFTKEELNETKKQAIHFANSSNSCVVVSSSSSSSSSAYLTDRRGVEGLSRAGALQLSSRRRYAILVVLDEQEDIQQSLKSYTSSSASSLSGKEHLDYNTIVERLAQCSYEATNRSKQCAVVRGKQDAEIANLIQQEDEGQS